MPTIDLRCDGTLYGRLTDNRWLEVRCRRRTCGYVKGITILHTIDTTSGKVVSTKRFAEPKNKKEGTQHAANNARAAVRAS